MTNVFGVMTFARQCDKQRATELLDCFIKSNADLELQSIELDSGKCTKESLSVFDLFERPLLSFHVSCS